MRAAGRFLLQKLLILLGLLLLLLRSSRGLGGSSGRLGRCLMRCTRAMGGGSLASTAAAAAAAGAPAAAAITAAGFGALGGTGALAAAGLCALLAAALHTDAGEGAAAASTAAAAAASLAQLLPLLLQRRSIASAVADLARLRAGAASAAAAAAGLGAARFAAPLVLMVGCTCSSGSMPRMQAEGTATTRVAGATVAGSSSVTLGLETAPDSVHAAADTQLGLDGVLRACLRAVWLLFSTVATSSCDANKSRAPHSSGQHWCAKTPFTTRIQENACRNNMRCKDTSSATYEDALKVHIMRR
jgi:hypothetical protein